MVEGISDRIFFEAIFRHFGLGDATGKVYEVVSVAGKMMFSQYEKLLKACHVPYVIIADLDYVKQVGSEAVKSIFSPSAQRIKQNVIDDPTSVDCANLLNQLDKAIQSGSTDNLKPVWEYIKSRQSRLRAGLTDAERTDLDSFIQEKRQQNCFILSAGTLEDYLPAECRGKDLEKLIRIVANSGFWDDLPNGARSELQEIVKCIKL